MTEQVNEEEMSPAEALKAAAEEAKKTEETDVQTEVASSTQEIEALKKQAADNFELYVRSVAEIENVRKRCAEDVVKAQKFGIEKFAKALLPVCDSLEKALEESAKGDPELHKGLEIVQKQLLHALDDGGVKQVRPAAGDAFDPNTQQAIMMVPVQGDSKAGTVAQVFQAGWLISERVLRPAMVSVFQG